MTADADLSPVHVAALEFYDAGFCVMPAKDDGSKAPVGNWKRYQTQRPTRDRVDQWFRGGHPAIGLVCGAVSGGLVLVELEGRAVEGGMFARAIEVALAAGDGDLWRRITSGGYLETTPSGGVHILYRITDAPTPGNQKLARRPGAVPPAVDVLAETRGEGGFVVVAPSHGKTHPSGKPWARYFGGPATVPSLTLAEHTRVCSILRTLDRMPAPDIAGVSLGAPTDGRRLGDRIVGDGELTPGDDYNQRATWQELLTGHGWRPVGARGSVVDWCRPGKNDGISATTGYGDADLLYVFTTSTLFDSECSYSKFAAYALLEHGGSYSEAARALRRDGYGGGDMPHGSLAPLVIPGYTPDDPMSGAAPHTQNTDGPAVPSPLAVDAAPFIGPQTPPTTDDAVHTSWWPRDLGPVIAGDTGDEIVPAYLARRDGERLFYPGKANGLIGESESGKTWVALLAAKQSLELGDGVLVLDFEDTAAGIVARLKALGVDETGLQRLAYVSPEETLHDLARADLAATMAVRRPGLVVLDGYNAAMGLLGLDYESNADVIKFSAAVLKPLARAGAAVVTVDHVTKAKEGRGTYAIGAQAKKAEADGCLLIVEAVEPFGRGMVGKLKLTVAKDRAGYVRGISGGGTLAGMATFSSSSEGAVVIKIEPPMSEQEKADRGPFRPTMFMERVSQFLLDVKEATGNTIEKNVTGKAEHVRKALTVLVDEGYVSRGPGPNGGVLFGYVKPFVNDLQAWNPDGGGDRDA